MAARPGQCRAGIDTDLLICISISLLSGEQFLSKEHSRNDVGKESPGPKYKLSDSSSVQRLSRGGPRFTFGIGNHFSQAKRFISAEHSKGIPGRISPGPGTYDSRYDNVTVQSMRVAPKYTFPREGRKSDGDLQDGNVRSIDRSVD